LAIIWRLSLSKLALSQAKKIGIIKSKRSAVTISCPCREEFILNFNFIF